MQTIAIFALQSFATVAIRFARTSEADKLGEARWGNSTEFCCARHRHSDWPRPPWRKAPQSQRRLPRPRRSTTRPTSRPRSSSLVLPRERTASTRRFPPARSIAKPSSKARRDRPPNCFVRSPASVPNRRAAKAMPTSTFAACLFRPGAPSSCSCRKTDCPSSNLAISFSATLTSSPASTPAYRGSNRSAAARPRRSRRTRRAESSTSLPRTAVVPADRSRPRSA